MDDHEDLNDSSSSDDDDEEDKDEISDTEESVGSLSEPSAEYIVPAVHPAVMFFFGMFARTHGIYSRNTAIDFEESIDSFLLLDELESRDEARFALQNGTCPDFLQSLPCTVLTEASPLLNRIQLVLPDGCTIDGCFVDGAETLRQGMYPTMLGQSPRVFGVKHDWINGAQYGLANEMQTAVWVAPGRTPQHTRARVGAACQAGATIVLLPASSDYCNLPEITNTTSVQSKANILVLIENETKLCKYLKQEPQDCFICVDKEFVACVICTSHMETGECLLRLPACKHMYHRDCLTKWLEEHHTCPTCRAELPKKIGQEDEDDDDDDW